MGKKKFIDKNKSRVFKLVQSSDYNSDNIATWKDITPQTNKNSETDFLTLELERVKLIEKPQLLTENEDLESFKNACSFPEARKYGIEFDDADTYDYMQHMKPINIENGFYENPLFPVQLRNEQLEAATNSDIIEIFAALESIDKENSSTNIRVLESTISCLIAPDVSTEAFKTVKPPLGTDGDLSHHFSHCSLEDDRLFEKILSEYDRDNDGSVKTTSERCNNKNTAMHTSSMSISMDQLLDDLNKFF